MSIGYKLLFKQIITNNNISVTTTLIKQFSNS